MRTDTGHVFRLEDYRPSDYLIPATGLTFRLSPENTVVLAELTVRRRRGAVPNAPLVLDGDGQSAVIPTGSSADVGALTVTNDFYRILHGGVNCDAFVSNPYLVGVAAKP